MGHKIRERRIQLGLRQDFVAMRVGITKSYLCQIENGHRGNRITYDLARKIANVLDTTPEEIIESSRDKM